MSSQMSRSARVPVEPAPMPTADTLGPITLAVRRTVNDIAGPRLARHQFGKNSVQSGVRFNRIAEKPAALGRHGIGRTEDFDAQVRIAAKLPQNPAADLRRLAVIARQFDQGTGMGRKKRL